MAEEHRKFSYLGTSEQQYIPAPPDLTERGFREITRIWRKPANKNNGEKIHCLIRGTYQHPGEWNLALATMARTLVGLYVPADFTQLDRDRMAAALLGGAISRIAAECPDINADMIEADIGDMYPDSNLHVHPPVDEGEMPDGPDDYYPPEPDYSTEPLPPMPTEGQSEAMASVAEPASAPVHVPVLDIDNRCLPVPPELLDDPNSQHLLTVWEQPTAPGCEDCPECGIDHMGRTYVGINTESLTNKAMGRTLGTLAKLHVQYRFRDRVQREIGYGEVMQAFHGFMVEGMPKQ